MMISISGDCKKEEIVKKFNEIFGDWAPQKVDFPEIQTVKQEFRPGVFFVNKNTDRTIVYIGHQGITRDNPDRYAIEIMDFILGSGGFNSRLRVRLLCDEGISRYSNSTFDVSERAIGYFYAACYTKSDSTIKAALIIKEELEKIRNKPVTQTELDLTKNSILSKLAISFDEPSARALNLMMLEYNNMPSDFYEAYIDNIRKTTVADVQRVANKYIQLDKLTYVITGNPEKFDKPLSTLGNPIEIKPDGAKK
jgi:predicted Zn-dependent peptidase